MGHVVHEGLLMAEEYVPAEQVWQVTHEATTKVPGVHETHRKVPKLMDGRLSPNSLALLP
jgi:hypothetical protein